MFTYAEDMRKVRASGALNFNHGSLKLFVWSKDLTRLHRKILMLRCGSESLVFRGNIGDQGYFFPLLVVLVPLYVLMLLLIILWSISLLGNLLEC